MPARATHPPTTAPAGHPPRKQRSAKRPVVDTTRDHNNDNSGDDAMSFLASKEYRTSFTVEHAIAEGLKALVDAQWGQQRVAIVDRSGGGEPQEVIVTNRSHADAVLKDVTRTAFTVRDHDGSEILWLVRVPPAEFRALHRTALAQAERATPGERLLRLVARDTIRSEAWEDFATLLGDVDEDVRADGLWVLEQARSAVQVIPLLLPVSFLVLIGSVLATAFIFASHSRTEGLTDRPWLVLFSAATSSAGLIAGWAWSFLATHLLILVPSSVSLALLWKARRQLRELERGLNVLRKKRRAEGPNDLLQKIPVLHDPKAEAQHP